MGRGRGVKKWGAIRHIGGVISVLAVGLASLGIAKCGPEPKICNQNVAFCENCAFSAANTCLGTCGDKGNAGGYKVTFKNNTFATLRVTNVKYTTDVPCQFWGTRRGTLQGPDSLLGLRIGPKRTLQSVMVRTGFDRCQPEPTAQCAVVDAMCGAPGSDAEWTVEVKSSFGDTATITCSLKTTAVGAAGFLHCTGSSEAVNSQLEVDIDPAGGVAGDPSNFTNPKANLSVTFNHGR